MEKYEFHCTKIYKIFLLIVFLFTLALSAYGIWFYITSSDQTILWFPVLFGVPAFFVFFRLFYLMHRPAIIFDGKNIHVLGWFGSLTKIDLNSDVEVTTVSDTYLVGKGKSTAVIDPRIIGKKQFGRLLNLVEKNGYSSNKLIQPTADASAD